MGLLTTIKKIFGGKSSVDRTLNCEDCRQDFVFDEGEQKFFQSKGFTDPKRCPRCRKRIKTRIHKKSRNHQRQNRYRGRGRRRSLIDGDSPYADE